MKKIAVTGLGVVTGNHQSAEGQFVSLFNGESTLKKDERLSRLGISDVVSSPVSSSVLSQLKEKHNLGEDEKSYEGNFVAYDAVNQAINDAGITQAELDNAGLFFGINKILPHEDDLNTLWKIYHSKEITNKERERVTDNLKSLKPDLVAQYLTQRLRIRGPALVFGDACAAGAAAIVSGFRRIQKGEIDIAVCGASELGTQPLMQLMFNRLGATSRKTFAAPQETSRPFDKDRAGCVLADASAFLILENAEHAKRRGKQPLAYISGASRQTESYKLTATNPDGSLYRECIENALANAGLEPWQINHINAHGTSTVSNDQAEAQAISSVFSAETTVTSTKSALGHSLAASGAIEAVLSVLSLQKQQVLPTLNFTEPKEGEPRISIVTKGEPQPLNHVLSNSFGFGGENCCLVFSRECQ